VQASGSGALSYQWLKDGSPILSSVSSVLSIAEAALADTGDYSVIVTLGSKSVTSSVARLTVTPPSATDFRGSDSRMSINYSCGQILYRLGEPCTISLVAPNGRVVVQNTVDGSGVIDLHALSLSRGTYFVRIKSRLRGVETRMVVLE